MEMTPMTDPGLVAGLCARVESTATCGCGQDLEGCSRAHCPRCGTSVAQGLQHEHVARGPLGWAA